MSARIVCIVCAALAGFSPAYANDCPPPPTTITGEMRIVETKHTYTGLIRAFVVFVEEGQCFSIEDEDGEHRNVCPSSGFLGQ